MKQDTNDPKTKLPLIVYDDECLMCTRFKDALQYLDKNQLLSFRPIQDTSLYQDYHFLDPQQCADTVHLVDDKFHVHRGPEVVEYLIKLIPGISKLSWLLEKESAKKAVELFYESVNKLRKSRLNTCPSCRK